MEKAMNVGGEVALKIVLEEFLNLHRGQGWYVGCGCGWRIASDM
jgi:hypothetical protein